MLGAFEIILVVVILAGLLIFARTRSLSLLPYLTIGILLLMVIVAMRMVRSLVELVIVLALVSAFLLWVVIRRT